MIRRYIVPLLAVAGYVIAGVVALFGNNPPPAAPPPVQSAMAPFSSYIAGAGLVEASTENIAVGTPASGVVTNIYVKQGDHVKPGDPLFMIDDRDLQAQLLAAVAKIRQAEANLTKAKDHMHRGEVLHGVNSGALSIEDFNDRRFDAAISETALATAKAEAEQIRQKIKINTVRALIPGQILQINIHLGEYAQSGALSSPLMLLGDDNQMHIRVNIDENDSWRFKAGASAMAFVRGNPTLKTPLRFVRVDPYIIPKTSLTGDSPERTDTRVLQVIYSFDPSTLPMVYAGQQMDVFVAAPPVAVQGRERRP